MIVVLEPGVSLKDKAAIVRFVEQHGGRLLVSELGEATVGGKAGYFDATGHKTVLAK